MYANLLYRWETKDCNLTSNVTVRSNVELNRALEMLQSLRETYDRDRKPNLLVENNRALFAFSNTEDKMIEVWTIEEIPSKVRRIWHRKPNALACVLAAKRSR